MQITNQDQSFDIRTSTLTNEVSNPTTPNELARAIKGMANREVHPDIVREVASEILTGRYTGGQLRTWGISLNR